MGVSDLLQRINNKGKVQAAAPPKATPPPGGNKPPIRPPLVGAGLRPVDPVVAALKEKRRLEKEKKEAELRAKKGLPPKTSKPKSQTAKREPGAPRAPPKKPLARLSRGATNLPPPPPPPPPRPPRQKRLFNELMQKAKAIDPKTLLVEYKPRSNTTPEPTTRPLKPQQLKPSERFAAKEAALRQRQGPRPPSGPVPSVSRVAGKKPPASGQIAPPKPMARGPSKAIQERLQQRKQHYGRNAGDEDEYYLEEEEEDDGFIVDDEEVEQGYDDQGGDYDRDEIWALFNRGRKRSHYTCYDDYDLDDMEATGAEVLEEEHYSRRNAVLEDQREAEEEARRAEEKRRRKLQRKS